MFTIKALDKLVTELKLRITLRTFRTVVAEIGRFARDRVINKQNEQFSKRLEGLKKKEELIKEKETIGTLTYDHGSLEGKK